MTKKKETAKKKGKFVLTETPMDETQLGIGAFVSHSLGVEVMAARKERTAGLMLDDENDLDPGYNCCVTGVLKPKRKRSVAKAICDGFDLLQLDGSFGR